MSNIQFVSSEKFTEDQYIKEIVYLCLEGKYRVAYLRKMSKSGGMYWGIINAGVAKNGTKQYYDAFMQDSKFLEEDIKDFLEKRSWDEDAPF